LRQIAAWFNTDPQQLRIRFTVKEFGVTNRAQLQRSRMALIWGECDDGEYWLLADVFGHHFVLPKHGFRSMPTSISPADCGVSIVARLQEWLPLHHRA
jgi:hypothetical protein